MTKPISVAARLLGFAAYYSYILLTWTCYPLIMLYINWRKHKQKEPAERFAERMGHPSLPRPSGQIIWLHGSSVGEALALLPIIGALKQQYPAAHLLVTTGTVTSAALLAKRLPADVLHQFVPLDLNGPWRRFLAYWQPSILILAESEFWPCMLHQAAKQMPIILVNARMSPRSLRRWRRFKPVFWWLLAHIRTVLAGSSTDYNHYQLLCQNLAQPPRKQVPNLKFASLPLPYDEAAYTRLASEIAGRPCILAASTHANEEEIIGKAHQELARQFPGLLTIIVPRHPGRAADISTQLSSELSLRCTRQSHNASIAADTDIYLVDAIGMLGLYYKLAPIAFIGGSLIAHGGQNMVEPARLGCAIITGPHTDNFVDIVKYFKQAEAMLTVKDAAELTTILQMLLTDHDKCAQYQQRAIDISNKFYADSLRPYLEEIHQLLTK